jgi:cytochrome P450
VALSLHRPKLSRSLNLVFPDTLDLLGEFDMERYRLQRRLIGPTYQLRNILKFENAVDDVLCKVIAQLRALQGAEVDLKEWMHIVTVECLAAIVLSWSPGYLKAKSDGGTSGHAYLGWRRKSIFGLFPFAEIVDSYSRTFGRAFAHIWRLTYKTPTRFRPFFPIVSNKITRRISASLRPKPPKDNRTDLMTELIQLHKDRPEFNEAYLKRMAMTNFGAGHETTTSALISIFSMLGTHPDTQARCFDEARAIATDGAAVTYSAAVECEYTQASIKEAQRLYPVIGMSLPREVPDGGTQIHGHYIPAGTTVGCSPASLHRNEDIFGPDSDRFNPERWLQQDQAREMDRYNLTWGGGCRTCPGRNLAQMMVFKIVPILLREFEIKVRMPTDEDIRYYFMAMLTGVKVRFTPRGNTH